MVFERLAFEEVVSFFVKFSLAGVFEEAVFVADVAVAHVVVDLSEDAYILFTRNELW